MAVIYLRHPVHGLKVASMDLEADADRENGWTDYDPCEMTPATDNAITRRRGRRPKADYETDLRSSCGSDPSDSAVTNIFTDAMGHE
jgi:hypothetical protein